ncbi:MAG: hypothetical protein JST28_18780 [Acidobacteria bacterium]|nr:hypothetical protein [Acidobacteriota bacterium]
MKLIAAVSLALAVTAPLALAKDKKKKDVPAAFNNARYVYVQAEDGDIMNPRLFPEDREAIADVQDELRDWNRYVVALNQTDADLIMVVRKGRLVGAQAHGGVGVGNGPALGGSFPAGRNPSDPNNRGGGVSTEMGGRAEAGPPDDTLRIYSVNPDGSRGALLWAHDMTDGLNAPQVLLVKQLKQEVERAYPPQTASQPAQKP